MKGFMGTCKHFELSLEAYCQPVVEQKYGICGLKMLITACPAFGANCIFQMLFNCSCIKHCIVIYDSWGTVKRDLGPGTDAIGTQHKDVQKLL